jgi:hypothetical protein
MFPEFLLNSHLAAGVVYHTVSDLSPVSLGQTLRISNLNPKIFELTVSIMRVLLLSCGLSSN